MANTRTVTVQQGDSLRKIAQREYGDPSLYSKIPYAGPLQAGQSITIPHIQPALIANPHDAMPKPAVPTAPAMTPQPALIQNPHDTMLKPRPVSAGVTPVQNPPVNAPVAAPVNPAVPAVPVTSPNNPTGVGAPNYGKPLATGGQQSFDLLSKLKAGTLSSDQTPVTAAEKEAFSMYSSYNKYKDYNGQQLADAIKAGELTPDPTNLLWRSLANNGKPTQAMTQAYALWDQHVKAGDATQAQNPDFLGGKWQDATSVEDLNALLNKDQRSATDKTNPTVPSVPEVGTPAYTDYESKVLAMLGGDNNRPALPQFEQSLNSLQTTYGVQADQNALNDVRSQIEELQAASRARQTANENGTVPMSVIAGRASEIEKQDRERLDALARQENAIVNRVNSSNAIIKQIMDTKTQDYGAAVDNYNQQFSQAIQTIGVFRDIQKDAQDRQYHAEDKAAAAAKAKADADKEEQTAARANLQVYYNNVTGGNIDVSTISPQQAVAVANMEVQAGMPVGTFLQLRSTNPTKEIKSTSDYVDENGQKHFDLVMVDRFTGKVSIQTIDGGIDAKSKLDIQKLQNDVDNNATDVAYKEAQTSKLNAEISADYETTSAGGFGGVTPKITGKYGAQYGAGVEANKSGMNQGVDLAVPVGTPVAIPEGATWKVISTATGVKGGNLKDYKNTPYGNSIMVENTATGERLRMSHLSEVKVKNGDTLDGGTIVGASGQTGNTSGPHLDLEYYNAKGQIGDALASTYGKFYTGGTTKKAAAKDAKEPTAAQVLKNDKATFSSLLQSQAGGDGHVSPDLYKTLKKNWVAQTDGDASDFDKFFQQYINPDHNSDYGLESSPVYKPYK